MQIFGCYARTAPAQTHTQTNTYTDDMQKAWTINSMAPTNYNMRGFKRILIVQDAFVVAVTHTYTKFIHSSIPPILVHSTCYSAVDTRQSAHFFLLFRVPYLLFREFRAPVYVGIKLTQTAWQFYFETAPVLLYLIRNYLVFCDSLWFVFISLFCMLLPNGTNQCEQV